MMSMTGRPVLAGLDAIDWPALSHAYGSAEDTPDLLRRLAAVEAEDEDAAGPANAGDSSDYEDSDDDDSAEDDASDEDSDDDEDLGVAQEILDDLWASICHQGSVYSATVAAVPFLAEIAAAGIETAQVLYLLGSIAEAADPSEVGSADPVRAAVAGCFEMLAPLLEEPEPDVREALIFVFAHSGPVERVRPVLLEIWEFETDPVMRAEVLHALIHVDPALAADLAEEVLSGDTDEAPLQVSAAYAWIRDGRALDERALTAARTPISGHEGDFSRWYADGILLTTAVEIADQHGASAAGDFLARALVEARESSIGVAEQRLEAARNLVLGFRDVVESLIEPITEFLGDPTLMRPAFSLLATIGPDAFTPRVRERLVMLSNGTEDFADDALAHLFTFGDPRAPELLGRHLADRPRALDAASGSMNRLEPGHVEVPFDPELLAAIRRRLTELADAASRPAPEDEDIFAGMRRTNEPIQLARVLGAWGEAALPAALELARILPSSTIPAARALAAIVGSARASGSTAEETIAGQGDTSVHIADEAVTTLRTVAGQGDASARATADVIAAPDIADEVVTALRAVAGQGDTSAHIAVAEAIRSLTGDSGPLLEIVLGALDGAGNSLSAAAMAAAELPEHAAALVPRLTEALLASPAPGESLPAHGDRIQLVSALHRLSGDTEHAIPVLRESLSLASELFTGWTVAKAADAAAALGADGRVLLPELTSALGDQIACPAAAEALLAIDPKGPWAEVDLETLGNHVIRTLTHGGAPRAHLRALDVLETLAPVLPLAVLESLHELVDRDQRILAALPDAQLVRADENARDRIRALLTR